MIANLKMLITIVVISLFITNSCQRKFSNKHKNNNQNQDKSASPSTSITSGTSQTATTSVNPESKQSQKPTQTKQTTNTQVKKQEKDNVKNIPKSDDQNKKQSDQKVQKKEQQKNYIVQYKMEPKANQYVIPIKIGSQQYNLGIGYDQEDSQYGNIGSWIFTNLTQQHSLCDAQDDCQDIQNVVKCLPNSTKQKQPNCIDKGKSKLSNEIIQSKKKVNVTFTNNNNTLSSIFISPSKISLKNNQIAQNQIQGVINLAFNNKQKYSNSLSLSANKIKIYQQKQLQDKLSQQNVIDLSKTGLLTLGDKKDIYIRTQDKTNKNQTNNIQLNYHKIKISFNKIEKTLAMPKNMITAIKNILKKQYFGDRCKIKDTDVNCSAAPIKKIEQIKLCRDKKGKNCIQLPILGAVIKQVISEKSYKLLIEENKEQQGNSTIIFYPYFSNFYQVYASKGLVKGVLLLNTTVQKAQKKQEKKQSSSNKKEQKQEKAQTKQVAKNKDQQKSQKQGKKQEKKQKVGQVSKNDKKQKTKDQKDQNQSQKDETDDYQNEDDDNEDSDTEQQKQKKDGKSSSQNKQKKQKASSSHKQSLTSSTDKSVQKGKIEQQKKYSKGILFFVFIYGSVFIGIIIVIKWKAQQSCAAAAIDRFLQVTWYSLGKNYFNKNRGYNAAFEDEQKGQQQIDHSDSIAVGYSQNKGKQLFWQNNSVQGI